MSRVTFNLTIGLVGADQREDVEFDGWNEMTEDERQECLQDWANNYVEAWYEEDE